MYSYAAAVMAPASTTPSSSSTAAPVIDINHPYFLSSADHPGLALVNEVLIASNYHRWSRSVRIALSAKLKLGFIDGSQLKPATTSSQYALWQRSNDLVISWMLNSMSSEIRKSVVYLHTAKQIWDDLSTRFSQTNVPRLFQLKKDLASLTQGSKSITAYFTTFPGLMDELDTLSPIPRCTTTSNCACSVSEKLDTYEKLNKLSLFLMGLNDQFIHTRGQLLLMTPLPDIGHAYAMLIQEENQRDFGKITTTMADSMALNVSFNSGNSQSKEKVKSSKKLADASLQCDYCHLSGHLKDKCFALHGYPEWHRLHGQPKPRVKSNNAKRANVAATVTSDTTLPVTSGPEPTLSTQQCHQLINMLQASLTKAGSSSTSAGPSANASCLQTMPSSTPLSGPWFDEDEGDW